VDQKALWDEMDIIEPHTYPTNIGVAVSAMDFTTFRKPGIFGEFGPAGGSGANARLDIQDGIFAGILSNHAGAGQYWYWENVQKQQLYPVFKQARSIVDASQWWSHPGAKSVTVKVISQSTTPGDLDCTPAIGWGQSDIMDFDVPNAINAGALGKCSSYLQGVTNRKLQVTPITYRFTPAAPGNVIIAFDQVSKSGASINITLDGKVLLAKSWKPGTEDLKVDERLSIPVSAGEHVLKLENTGADWAHIKEVKLPGVAPALIGRGLVDGRWGLFSLQGSTGVTVDVVLGLPDANYKAIFWDLDTNVQRELHLTVSKGKVVDFSLPFPRSIMLATG
jgi:hypothetical protein